MPRLKRPIYPIAAIEITGIILKFRIIGTDNSNTRNGVFQKNNAEQRTPGEKRQFNYVIHNSKSCGTSGYRSDGNRCRGNSKATRTASSVS